MAHCKLKSENSSKAKDKTGDYSYVDFNKLSHFKSIDTNREYPLTALFFQNGDTIYFDYAVITQNLILGGAIDDSAYKMNRLFKSEIKNREIIFPLMNCHGPFYYISRDEYKAVDIHLKFNEGFDTCYWFCSNAVKYYLPVLDTLAYFNNDSLIQVYSQHW